MGRMKKVRYCRRAPGFRLYKPTGVPLRDLAVVELLLDELEAMRLADLEGLDQQGAADQMGISRGTLQRLLWAGRRDGAGLPADRRSRTRAPRGRLPRTEDTPLPGDGLRA